MSDQQVQRFAPAGGRVTGILGLILAAIVVVLWIRDSDTAPLPVLTGALVFAMLCWTAVLRPRVSMTATTLILRNMVTTTHIPLAAIDELRLRHVLEARTATTKYVGAGL